MARCRHQCFYRVILLNLLLGALHVLHSQHGFVLCKLCPPAEEGKPFSLEHRVKPGMDLSLSHLVWSVGYHNGDRQEVSHCHFYEDSCKEFTMEFRAKRYSSPSDTISTFEISRVHADHRQMEIVLETMLGNMDKRKELYRCTMEVYSQPKNPKCTAERKSKNYINVNCTATEAYPGVICELYQVNLDTMQSVKIEDELEYRQRMKNNDMLHREASCSTTVFVPKPGSYKYKAKMMPKVLGNERLETQLSPLSEKVIVSEFKVAVVLKGPRDRNIEVCPNHNRTVLFTCEAKGFKRRPKLRWTVNGLPLAHNTGKITERPSPNGRVYREDLDFLTLHYMDTVTVQCSTRDEHEESDTRQLFLANDSVTLHFKRLAYISTTILYRGSRIEDNEIFVTEKENKLTCQIDKTYYDALGVEMLCRREGQMILRKSTTQRQLSVSLAEEYTSNSPIHCECQATSETKCRQRPVSVELHLLGEVAPNNNPAVDTAVIILSVVASALFLALDVLLCLYCRHRIRRGTFCKNKSKHAGDMENESKRGRENNESENGSSTSSVDSQAEERGELRPQSEHESESEEQQEEPAETGSPKLDDVLSQDSIERLISIYMPPGFQHPLGSPKI